MQENSLVKPLTDSEKALLDCITGYGFGEIVIKVSNGVPNMENGAVRVTLRLNREGREKKTEWKKPTGKQEHPNYCASQLELIREVRTYRYEHKVKIKFQDGNPSHIEASRSLV